MKVAWICGLPNQVRIMGCGHEISPIKTAAWSWILGHLPPPPDLDLHILCPVVGLEAKQLDFEYLGVKWHCVRQERGEQFLLWRRILIKFRAIIGEVSPDIIHGWGGETGCAYLATLLSSKALVGVQGLLRYFDDLLNCRPPTRLFPLLKWRLGRYIERKSYEQAFKCITESNTSARALKDYYGRDGAEIIPHPLRSLFLRGNTDSTRNRVEIRFLFLGSLEHRKGALDAVDAFMRASVRGSKLIMIGSGPLSGEIEPIINKSDRRADVRMLGTCSVERICEEMRSAHFFLLPSYGDTGPSALKEAIAQGLYPICYDNSGPSEYLRLYCGTLVPTGDVDALSCALVRCSERLDACLQDGYDASVRIKCDLEPKAVWEKLRGVYGSVCG